MYFAQQICAACWKRECIRPLPIRVFAAVQRSHPFTFHCIRFIGSDGLKSSDVLPLLCDDLLSNGVHEYDVLLSRQLFLDFTSGKIDCDYQCSVDSSFAAVPNSRSLMYHLSETVCAHLVIKVLKPSYFWLCSKQDDVAFFKENSMKFTKDIKESRVMSPPRTPPVA